MGQIQLPQASMPVMTPFHHSQFHSPILVEVAQLIPDTFSNVSKNHDPSSLPSAKKQQNEIRHPNKNGLI